MIPLLSHIRHVCESNSSYSSKVAIYSSSTPVIIRLMLLPCWTPAYLSTVCLYINFHKHCAQRVLKDQLITRLSLLSLCNGYASPQFQPWPGVCRAWKAYRIHLWLWMPGLYCPAGIGATLNIYIHTIKQQTVAHSLYISVRSWTVIHYHLHCAKIKDWLLPPEWTGRISQDTENTSLCTLSASLSLLAVSKIQDLRLKKLY